MLLPDYLFSATAVQAADTNTEHMTCQEFINLNPKAMLPVAFWMLNDKTTYKGGDTVDLQETNNIAIPQVIDLCKKHPQNKLYDFKNEIHDLLKK